jgi:hypothetical protein
MVSLAIWFLVMSCVLLLEKASGAAARYVNTATISRYKKQANQRPFGTPQ